VDASVVDLLSSLSDRSVCERKNFFVVGERIGVRKSSLVSSAGLEGTASASVTGMTGLMGETVGDAKGESDVGESELESTIGVAPTVMFGVNTIAILGV
jgi:hypothetical protein